MTKCSWFTWFTTLSCGATTAFLNWSHSLSVVSWPPLSAISFSTMCLTSCRFDIASVACNIHNTIVSTSAEKKKRSSQRKIWSGSTRRLSCLNTRLFVSLSAGIKGYFVIIHILCSRAVLRRNHTWRYNLCTSRDSGPPMMALIWYLKIFASDHRSVGGRWSIRFQWFGEFAWICVKVLKPII